jgi:hypothetical protein
LASRAGIHRRKIGLRHATQRVVRSFVDEEELGPPMKGEERLQRMFEEVKASRS